MLVGSIDLSKIEKNRIVSTDKDGKPFSNGAKYYNVVCWINDEPDQYGNTASVQSSVTKEEREQGQKGSYIGNLRDLQAQQAQTNPTQQQSNVSVSDVDDDGLPF
ncbi:hypothetical protein AVT43_gp12 [Polaribacter phage P12002L]|uniref:Uncharacterized protein n=2 Tax=Incheonvirus TaxID=2976977 RepID=A0A0F7IJN2_9CAUD|nr:hypothetical protein AVT42_gp12 [Polaribacter phage P12002S]YP_009209672.1 hypothetical protein AVT43_gp12 [Polaribacter phage P12002L]AKG94186.1 hypothetical protein P12002L_0012 [Polaribacter phage P12002L]AKG94268.1 hypothetical protein P12002S_0012 [Polaribacter phage P12002S]